MLAFAVQITRGLSPVSAGYLMAFESQPPPNSCQAHKSGGPGVLAIGGANRPGSVPGEYRLLDGI